MAPSACHLCQKECIGARNQYFLSRTEEESELFLRREVYLAIKRRADKEWVGRYYLKYGRNNNFLKPSMSRIGKRQIEIPDKTTVTVVDDRVWVKGPLGEIERKYNQAVSIAVDGKTVKVNPVKVTLESQSLWGTYNAHIVNMIKGVNQLFNKKLV